MGRIHPCKCNFPCSTPLGHSAMFAPLGLCVLLSLLVPGSNTSNLSDQKPSEGCIESQPISQLRLSAPMDIPRRASPYALSAERTRRQSVGERQQRYSIDKERESTSEDNDDCGVEQCHELDASFPQIEDHREDADLESVETDGLEGCKDHQARRSHSREPVHETSILGFLYEQCGDSYSPTGSCNTPGSESSFR